MLFLSLVPQWADENVDTLYFCLPYKCATEQPCSRPIGEREKLQYAVPSPIRSIAKVLPLLFNCYFHHCVAGKLELTTLNKHEIPPLSCSCGNQTPCFWYRLFFVAHRKQKLNERKSWLSVQHVARAQRKSLRRYVPAKSIFLRSTSLSAPSGRRHKYKAMKRKITILLPETKHQLANWNSKLLYIKVLATLTAASWHFVLRVFINKSAVCVRWKNFWNKQLWGMFLEGGGEF